MILISHRGNINGRIVEKENRPGYIEAAIKLGYDVEMDIWLIDDGFYLGHDSPKYEVSYDWVFVRNEKLWLHCKNVDCISFLSSSALNYFWHESDTVTLTSKKYIWAFPGKQPIKNSIAVLPECYVQNISQCVGVCSDVIADYK